MGGKKDGSEEYDNGGVLGEDEEKRVLHAGHVSRVQAMKEKHLQAVRDFVQDEQGKGDDDELGSGVG